MCPLSSTNDKKTYLEKATSPQVKPEKYYEANASFA
jgi:hypothetical protein